MSKIDLDEFRKRLANSDELLLKNMEKTFTILGFRMEEEAKQNATEFPMVDLGHLRRSITGRFEIQNGKPGAYLRAGGDSGGFPVDYANFVEFGTVFMAPRLFMERAVTKVKENDVPQQFKGLIVSSLTGKEVGK